MNIQTRVSSPAYRGLSSPRRGIISTRALSPSARVNQIRKLPSLDTRSLLANPNLEYEQPAYILEQKMHLCQEVDALRREVYPLRDHCECLASSFEDNIGTDNDGDDIDPLREVTQHELQNRLDQYQLEINEIESSLAYFGNVLTEETEETLMSTVTSQKQQKSELDELICDMNILQEERKTALTTVTSANSENVKKFEANQERIIELMDLLNELRDEEKKMLEKHEKMCSLEPSPIDSVKEIDGYVRRLQMLEHSRARKLVDVRKLQKENETQKEHMISLKEAKIIAEKKRQERIAFNKTFQERAKALEENQRIIAEMQKENSQKMTSTTSTTTLTTTTNSSIGSDEQNEPQINKHRRKHKRRHWHHHNDEIEGNNNAKNEEVSGDANTEFSDSEIVTEFDDTPIGVVERVKPETFKTEIENTDSIHLSTVS